MDADEFISGAIELGQSRGMDALDPQQRLVWMISEAEVHCDKDGIDALIHRYGIGAMSAFADAFHIVGAAEIGRTLAQIAQRSGPGREASLALANSLITSRFGYSYESIRAAITSDA